MQRPWRGGACWLVPQGLLSLLFFFFNILQDHLPGGPPPILIINPEKAFSQITLTCVKLTETIPHIEPYLQPQIYFYFLL